MTLEEVADYLRVHPSTIYRLIKKVSIPGFKLGSDWRFHRETIDRWMSQRESQQLSAGVASEGNSRAQTTRPKSAKKQPAERAPRRKKGAASPR